MEKFPGNAAEALVYTVRDICKNGARVGDAEHKDNEFTEILGYTTGMENPRARVGIGVRPLNTVGAVARFVWLVAGSDRLEDIAYYETRVRAYSDDGLSVPGSSYGKRLFNSSPGTNQIAGVVQELHANFDSRRAAAVVWLPEDAVRQSKDIPCTFGLFFHIREGGLIMTTVMRSNNAVTLVPYNFFEFSMIGEIVAAELGVPFTRYVHWAASMHVFDSMNAERDKILAITSPEAATMPEMPRGAALEKAYSLARYEAELRHASTADELARVTERAREELGEYWKGFFEVLYVYGLAKRGLRDETMEAFQLIPEHFKLGAEKSVNAALGPDLTIPNDTSDALFELEDIDLINSKSTAARVAEAAAQASTGDRLLDTLSELSVTDAPLTLGEILSVREELAGRDFTLAARGAGSAEAPWEEAVALAVEEVYRRRSS